MSGKALKILVLPGDGIGPEVTREAIRVLEWTAQREGANLELEEAAIGGTCLEAHGVPLQEETLAKGRGADAVLLGAVGGPQWDNLPHEKRPEQALLKMRSGLELFANLRPAKIFGALTESSTLKMEVIDGIDLMVVRELTGGIYFGQPQGVESRDGERVGFNTLVYSESEIRRVAERAFEIARVRRNKVTSVDKANVLTSSQLWRETVTEVAKNYSDVELDHLYVDNCAMQLVRYPAQFDVIVTGNLFGDILSDEAAMLTGSIGMLPSASIGALTNSWERPLGLYEPVHGSAPDIAGEGKANPLATILSVAMLWRYSCGQEGAAQAIEAAVEKVLAEGQRTADLGGGSGAVSTEEMGEAVLRALENA